jgi:hypothetical protein
VPEENVLGEEGKGYTLFNENFIFYGLIEFLLLCKM